MFKLGWVRSTDVFGGVGLYSLHTFVLVSLCNNGGVPIYETRDYPETVSRYLSFSFCTLCYSQGRCYTIVMKSALEVPILSTPSPPPLVICCCPSNALCSALGCVIRRVCDNKSLPWNGHSDPCSVYKTDWQTAVFTQCRRL